MFGGLGSLFDGLVQAIAAIPGAIVDGLKFLFDGIVSAVKAVAGAVWAFFSDPIGSLVSGFTSLLNFLGGLVSAIGDLLKALFVPSDDYFDSQFNMLSKTLGTRVKTQDYEELLASLQVATRASTLPDMTTTIMGQQLTIVDMSWYSDYQTTIYGWVRGVMFVLLLFYNINQVYKLIRRDTLQNGSSGSQGGDSK
ncbi:hypothetical protein NSA22_00785 [Longicatena caecimuris]|uniref:hypothetical protein n=1 Tax=Longicatena caecimuris TaxID=1796635 RepID=UPI0010463580|nr:hypothetical protein [Longicatena caecimuris]MCR1868964.1 hypothetical protein [Longicatena caecimuris]MCR1868973.1 hypothetical protein [Longicatena caecimuris]